MTAPTTITVTGTFYDPDNTFATGKVVFTPTDTRAKNNVNVIDQEPVIATIGGSGALSQVLVNLTNGYDVQELVDGRLTTPSYHIAGTGSIDLSTV